MVVFTVWFWYYIVFNNFFFNVLFIPTTETNNFCKVFVKKFCSAIDLYCPFAVLPFLLIGSTSKPCFFYLLVGCTTLSYGTFRFSTLFNTNWYEAPAPANVVRSMSKGFNSMIVVGAYFTFCFGIVYFHDDKYLVLFVS